MSILADCQALLGIPPDDTAFMTELLIHINSAVTFAFQMGFAIDPPAEVTASTDWPEIFKPHLISMLKEWLPLKVRSVWDPPQGSSKEAVDSRIEEVETRLRWAVDTPALGGETVSWT